MVKSVYQEETMTIYEAEDFNSTQRNLHIFLAGPVTCQWDEPKVFESTFSRFLRTPFFFLHFL